MINSVVNFFIQSGICFCIFYSFYYFLLRKETCFGFNRFFLITASLLSFVLPLINFEFFFIHNDIDKTSIGFIRLPEVTVLASEMPPSFLNVGIDNLLIIGYMTGVTFFLFRFLIQVFKIKSIINRNRYNIKYWKGCNLIQTNGKLPTFSYFNYLFWDNTLNCRASEKSQVLAHELVHIRGRHSYDIIFFEILNVIFWFNPIIRFFKKSMKDIHEYIADATVSESVSDNSYAGLIVSQLFKDMNLAVGSYFNKSQTIRRIEMLKKNRTTKIFKPLLSIPVAGIILLIMAFKSQTSLPLTNEKELPVIQLSVVENLSQKGDVEPMIEHEDLEDQEVKMIEKKSSTKEVGITNKQQEEIVEDNTIETLPPSNEVAFSDKNNEEQNSILDEALANFINEQELKKEEKEIPENEVFTIVEKQPSPQGGMGSFYQYIKKNLKYPKTARLNEIEGKVFLQFIVAANGEITEVQTLKGIDKACDQEAERVLKESPRWNPGEQRGLPVQVRMVIPITFRLG